MPANAYAMGSAEVVAREESMPPWKTAVHCVTACLVLMLIFRTVSDAATNYLWTTAA